MVQSRRFYLIAALFLLVLLSLLASFSLPNGSIDALKGTLSTGYRDRLNKSDAIDWHRFAYVQYVTNLPYLCNSVMLFESLHRLGCKPDRLMMFPSHFSTEDNSTEALLLRKARDEYRVILKPIEVQMRQGNDRKSGDSTWAESYTKFLAFNQTEYERILHLDSDSTVLQSMDELFLIQPAFVAMPRAYWLGFDDRVLSSQLLLLQPSEYEFNRLMEITDKAGGGSYDMDILTDLYKDYAMVLPHRPYDLLTGEFKGTEHSKYIGDPDVQWDPDAIMKELKFLHFSDWPLPKPWLASATAVDGAKPQCAVDLTRNQTTSCRDQEIWIEAYTDFRRRRKEICDIEVDPNAPSRRKRSVGRHS